MTLTIAIDGPAGSGKSSVSKEAARRLSYGYLDTGAAYRALAWHTLARGADTADAKLAIMEDCGFKVTRNPSEMGRLLKSLL